MVVLRSCTVPALHRRCRPVVAIEAFIEELEFSRGTLCDIHTCKASDRTTFCDKSHFSLFLAAFACKQFVILSNIGKLVQRSP